MDMVNWTRGFLNGSMEYGQWGNVVQRMGELCMVNGTTEYDKWGNGEYDNGEWDNGVW